MICGSGLVGADWVGDCVGDCSTDCVGEDCCVVVGELTPPTLEMGLPMVIRPVPGAHPSARTLSQVRCTTI